MSSTTSPARLFSAVLIVCTVLATTLAISNHNKQKRVKKLRQQLDADFESHTAPDYRENPHSEALIREQLSRNYAFLGEKGQKALRSSFVIVVGCGGVGSHAAHMLIRAGVQRIRVIDFDQLTLSSMNRHAIATLVDVGTPKALVLKKRFQEIAPHVKVDARVELFSRDNAEVLLSGNPDYVLDCIDNLETKVELIGYCVKRKMKLISSMGAGGKADPTRICIADISDTREDPLARKVRRLLKKVGIQRGFKTVFSIEKESTNGLVDLDEDKVADAHEYATLPNFRSRILPVLGPLPALFGNCMATHVITELSNFYTDALSNKLRHTTYCKMHRDLTLLQKTPEGRTLTIGLDVYDVGFIFEEVWRGQSAISGNQERLVLVRWDPSKDPTFGNLVCLHKKEALKHEEFESLEQVEAYYGEKIVDYVKQRFTLEANMNAHRFPRD